jgi:hypothetical protein
MSRLALFMVGTLVSLGCYHATIETGKPPAPETIDKQWATSLIFGLVPPSVTETAQKCPNGVSKVETQQTFLNGVVRFLTFGIYTPMAIKVTCAAKSSADAGAVIRADENGGTPAELVQRAAELSRGLNAPVMIDFR